MVIERLRFESSTAREAHSGVERGSNIGVPEVVSHEEERLVPVPGEGVGEAIAEVELGRMAATLAIGAIRKSGDSGLCFGHRFDRGSDKQ